MRLVPLKLVDQQVRFSSHSVREGCNSVVLAIGNRTCGLLAEFGVVIAPSDAASHRWRVHLDSVSVPSELIPLIRDLAAQ